MDWKVASKKLSKAVSEPSISHYLSTHRQKENLDKYDNSFNIKFSKTQLSRGAIHRKIADNISMLLSMLLGTLEVNLYENMLFLSGLSMRVKV